MNLEAHWCATALYAGGQVSKFEAPVAPDSETDDPVFTVVRL